MSETTKPFYIMANGMRTENIPTQYSFLLHVHHNNVREDTEYKLIGTYKLPNIEDFDNIAAPFFKRIFSNASPNDPAESKTFQWITKAGINSEQDQRSSIRYGTREELDDLAPQDWRADEEREFNLENSQEKEKCKEFIFARNTSELPKDTHWLTIKDHPKIARTMNEFLHKNLVPINTDLSKAELELFIEIIKMDPNHSEYRTKITPFIKAYRSQTSHIQIHISQLDLMEKFFSCNNPDQECKLPRESSDTPTDDERAKQYNDVLVKSYDEVIKDWKDRYRRTKGNINLHLNQEHWIFVLKALSTEYYASQKIFQRLLFADIQSIADEIRFRIEETRDIFAYFYEFFSEKERKVNPGRGITKITGLRASLLHTLIDHWIIKLCSLFDLVSQLVYEYQESYTDAELLAYPKLKSRQYQFSKVDAILQNNNEDKKGNHLEQKLQKIDVEGTIYEKNSWIRYIKGLRNYSIHEGSLSSDFSFFIVRKDGQVFEKYIFLPDYDPETFRVHRYKNRSRFYSQKNKCNEMLPILYSETISRVKKTLDVFILNEARKSKTTS